MSKPGGASVGIGGPHLSVVARGSAGARRRAGIPAGVGGLARPGDGVDDSFQRHLDAAPEAAEGAATARSERAWERFAGTSFERAAHEPGRRGGGPIAARAAAACWKGRCRASRPTSTGSWPRTILAARPSTRSSGAERALHPASARAAPERGSRRRTRNAGATSPACAASARCSAAGSSPRACSPSRWACSACCWPAANPLCFTPQHGKEGFVLACPQTMTALGDVDPSVGIDAQIAAAVKPGDIALIEFLGLLGAGLSVVAVLRNLKKGTSTPVQHPVLARDPEAPDGRAHRGRRADAHAGGLRPRPQRAGHVGADPRLGAGLRHRPATGHAPRGQPRGRARWRASAVRGAAGDRPVKTPS